MLSTALPEDLPAATVQHISRRIDTDVTYQHEVDIGIDLSPRAYEGLTSLGLERVASVAKRMLLDSDPYRRGLGAEMLVRIDRLTYLPIIVQLLQDSDCDDRSHMCGLLSVWGNENVQDQVIRELHRAPGVTCRIYAAEALASIGGELAITALQWSVANDHGVDWENRSCWYRLKKRLA